MNSKPYNRLSLVLWLAAVHSILVGLGLMIIPPSRMTLFGLESGGERFFQAQGGAFHFVMAMIYAWAALRQLRMRELILLAVVIKCAAAVFLITYSLAVGMIWVVLVSAAVDALMAALIYSALVSCEKESLQRLGRIHPGIERLL